MTYITNELGKQNSKCKVNFLSLELDTIRFAVNLFLESAVRRQPSKARQEVGGWGVELKAHSCCGASGPPTKGCRCPPTPLLSPALAHQHLESMTQQRPELYGRYLG